MSDSSGDELAPWIARADEAFEQLQRSIEDRQLSNAIESVQSLIDIADEVEDIMEHVDLSEVPDAVDVSELPDAIEVEDIPEAVGEEDATEALDLTALMKAVKLRELWDSANLSALLKEETGDGLGEDISDDVESTVDDATDDFGDGEIGDMPSQEWQEMIQLKAMDAITEFRTGVLEAHDRLETLHEENREKMRRQHDQTRADSRNPTAYSSLSTERPDIAGHATSYSTVSPRVRHSTAPELDRVYGHRYDKEAGE